VKELLALLVFNLRERIREWRTPEAPDLVARLQKVWAR
jgi:hypothetical protein